MGRIQDKHTTPPRANLKPRHPRRRPSDRAALSGTLRSLADATALSRPALLLLADFLEEPDFEADAETVLKLIEVGQTLTKLAGALETVANVLQ